MTQWVKYLARRDPRTPLHMWPEHSYRQVEGRARSRRSSQASQPRVHSRKTAEPRLLSQTSHAHIVQTHIHTYAHGKGNVSEEPTVYS